MILLQNIQLMKTVFLSLSLFVICFLIPIASSSANLTNKLEGKWISNQATQIWHFESKNKQATLERINENDKESYTYKIQEDKVIFYLNKQYAFEFQINSIGQYKVQFSEKASGNNLFLYKISSNINPIKTVSILKDKSFTFSNQNYEIEYVKENGIILVYPNGKYHQYSNFNISPDYGSVVLNIHNLKFLVLRKKKEKYLIASLNGDFTTLELRFNKAPIKQSILKGKWKAIFETDNNVYKDTLHLFIDFRSFNNCFLITNSRVFNPTFKKKKIYFYNNYGIIKHSYDRYYSDDFEYLIKLPKEKQKLDLEEVKLIRIPKQQKQEKGFTPILIKKIL